VAKATIARLDKNGVADKPIEVMFNPKELTFARQNNWSQKQAPKTNIPSTEFGGGGPTTLKLQLYFDTYTTGKDVRKEYTDKICELMELDPKWEDKKTHKGRPPSVRFQWGKIVTFDAVITSINERFTLFLPNDAGTPVRAVLDVSFTEVKSKKDKPAQNPTSGGPGGERIWIVRAGDTLPWIAFSEYDDATQWRRIADANGLTQIRRLTPGAALVIPSV
jgi:hypothetical protein